MSRIWWLLCCAAMCGCASADPDFYTLREVDAQPHTLAGGVIEVRRPGLAGYLDRADIVVSQEGYQLALSPGARWAEPLADMAGRVLSQDLAQRLPGANVFAEGGAISAAPSLRVEINIARLDRAADGNLVLVAQMVVQSIPSHTVVTAQHFAAEAACGNGARGQAAAASALLGQLADQLANTIAAARFLAVR